MSTAFDAFVGIDWSGARAPGGIAVAEAGREGAPRLVSPPGGARHWTRTAAFDWLDARLRQGCPLVGIDAAFALPFSRATAYFPGRDATVFDLWDHVEAYGGGAPDWYGGEVARHPALACDFWTAGPQPADWDLPRRAVEIACRLGGDGTPDSPYKLIGSKQVGKGALAAMRVLRALKARHGDRMAVWPFEAPAGRATVVEIYPRLFLRRAGFGNRKLRNWDELAEALAVMGSPSPPTLDRPPSDHETDALASAAGLRWLADDPRVWSPPGLDARARRQEGWIFGVGT